MFLNKLNISYINNFIYVANFDDEMTILRNSQDDNTVFDGTVPYLKN